MTSELEMKRRVITIAHFAASVISYLSLFNTSGFRLEKLFFVLQPQFLFLGRLEVRFNEDAIAFLAVFFAVAWSFCFGWLVTKLVNWLNHFPVLGRKVF